MEIIIVLVLAFGLLWLMSSRTRKQQREQASFRANLAVGQEVMTASGYFGTVVDVEDDVVVLESTPGNTSRWLRAAVARVVEPPADDGSDEDDADEDADGEADVDENGQDWDDADYVDDLEVPDDLSALDRDERDGPDEPRPDRSK